jgi:hypothetical protein
MDMPKRLTRFLTLLAALVSGAIQQNFTGPVSVAADGMRLQP